MSDSNDKTIRAAVLEIAPEVLGELLQLPKGAEVVYVHCPFDLRGVMSVKIYGAGWPVKEGEMLQTTTGTITRKFAADGSEVGYSVDWGFPEE